MKNVMKSICLTLAWVAPALAAAEAGPEESGLLIALFLGFGALVILFQFIPSLLLFGSMLKGLFTSTSKETALSTVKKTDK